MRKFVSAQIVAFLAFGVVGVVTADDAPQSTQTMLRDAKDTNVGVATISDTPNGVLIHIDFAGLTPGVHAFHIHETGKCEPPFKSAGGHFNPAGKHHGFEDKAGFHAGDMPNVVIPASGAAKVDIFVEGVHLNSGPAKLFDADGSALVVHAGPDDYKSDPAGNAGDRIACGVVEPLQPVTVKDVELAP